MKIPKAKLNADEQLKVDTAVGCCKILILDVGFEQFGRKTRRKWINHPKITEKICEKYSEIRNLISESKFSYLINVPQGTFSVWMRLFEAGQVIKMEDKLNGENLAAQGTTINMEDKLNGENLISREKNSVPIEKRNPNGGKVIKVGDINTGIKNTIATQEDDAWTLRTSVGTSHTGDIIIKRIETRTIKRGTPAYEEFCREIHVPGKYFNK